VSAALLEIRGLIKRYRNPGITGLVGRRAQAAVDEVDLRVQPGESVGLIGESGSGKTTLVRAALGLLGFEGGEVQLLGRPLHALSRGELRALRSRCQLMLQSPDASLNPGLSVREHLWESARLHQPEREPAALVEELAGRVGISHRLEGLPYELSGGEKRRVGIARLLIADPDLTVADEPTAGLDAALKAEITDLLLATRAPDRGHLFISHDIPLITYACERIAVMYAGRVVEELPVESIGAVPHHPYTGALLHAAGFALEELPVRVEPPAGRGQPGCPYRGPCPFERPACSQHRPALRAPDSTRVDHRVACHHVAPGDTP
jgi:oligopeptide/dipeptide ABC transporter ATP-binding protein